MSFETLGLNEALTKAVADSVYSKMYQSPGTADGTLTC